MCLHYIWVVMLHIQVVCFELMAAWKGCYDMRKVCGNICEGCNVRQNLTLNIHLVKTYFYTMIFILVYTKSFKSIKMLAYRASFCYVVDLKFVQMLSFRKFVFTKFLTSWVRVEIVMCDSRMVINSIF